MTLIQRFGSALNLNVHFHLLVLDGVYRRDGEGRLVFVPVASPSAEELKGLVQRIAERIGRSLERSGFSLHAGIAAKASQRDEVRSRSDREGALGYKIERLARYLRVTSP